MESTRNTFDRQIQQKNGLLNCLQALESRNFRLYLFGQIMSALGTGMQNVALSWLIYRLTNSAAALSFFAASIVLPQLLLSFAGGCLADTKDKKLVMTGLQFFGAGVAALIFGGTFVANPGGLLVLSLAFIYGCFIAMEYPARHAFTGRIVAADQLVSARGLYSGSCATALAVGQVLAGLIIEWGGDWGERSCFLLNLMSYVVSTLMIRNVVLDARKSQPASDASQPSKAHETGKSTKSGSPHLFTTCLQHIRQSEVLVVTFLQTVILVLFFTRYANFLPAFASEIFHGGPKASGLLSAALAVGYAAAAFVCGGIRQKETLANVASLSLLVLPAALVMFSLSPHLGAGVACVFAIAFLQSANINACVATMQLTAPDGIFGRLMGLRVTLIALLELIAALVAGQLTGLLGLSSTIIVTAIPGAIACVLLAYRRLPIPALNTVPVSARSRSQD